MTIGGGPMHVVVRNACAAHAARIAADLHSAPPPLDRPGRRSSVILFDAEHDDDLAAMLAEPVTAIIDLGCADPIGGLVRLPSSLLVRVSTAMALRCDIAGPLAAALCARLPQAHGAENTLRAALQEAIANAVIHGNLGMGGGLRGQRDGLETFARLMEARAKDPLLIRRSVTIAAKWNARALVLTVEDCGAGFEPAGRAGRLPAATAASGRGLAQIRAACGRVNVLAQGRRISMRFNWQSR
jgi:hypothetical protein